MKTYQSPEPLENFLTVSDEIQGSFSSGIKPQGKDTEMLFPEIKEHPNKFTLKFNVNGFSKRSLYVFLYKNILWINGTQYTFRRVFFGLFERLEKSKLFQRPVMVPNNINRVSACCKDNVLTVDLYKQPSLFGGKVIPVKPKGKEKNTILEDVKGHFKEAWNELKFLFFK